jgi:general secretion pathway protein G
MDSTGAVTTRINFTKARISIIENALYKFKNDVGRFPYTEEGLSALLWFPADMADWNGPYINRDQPPMDGWNHHFIYNYPPVLGEKDFDLYSLGPNGVDENGDGDDIANW